MKLNGDNLFLTGTTYGTLGEANLGDSDAFIVKMGLNVDASVSPKSGIFG